MVATVQIGEKNGASPIVFTDKTSGTIRFKNADDKEVDTADPMVIPTAAQDYSFEKWLRLKVTVAPDTNISNLKFYTDGSSGWAAQVKLWAKAVATYAAPAEATATAGYTDAFTYTSAAALDLGTAAVTGTGEKGSHTVMMMEVETGATQGALAGETMTFSFDEM